MAGDGECWLKRKKKKNTASQIALSYKWVMPLMVWKQRGIFREEVSEWQMDSVSATLHSVCVVLKEYMTAFFLWTYWLKQQSLGSAVFTAKIASVCVCRLVCACMCLHAQRSKTITALCGSDGNNRQVGGIRIHLRWDLSHCQASKTFVYCLTFGYKLRLKSEL